MNSVSEGWAGREAYRLRGLTYGLGALFLSLKDFRGQTVLSVGLVAFYPFPFPARNPNPKAPPKCKTLNAEHETPKTRKLNLNPKTLKT